MQLTSDKKSDKEKIAKRKISGILSKIKKTIKDYDGEGSAKSNPEVLKKLRISIEEANLSREAKGEIYDQVDRIEEAGMLKTSDIEKYLKNSIKELYKKGVNIATDPDAQKELVSELLLKGNFKREFLKQELLRIITEDKDFAKDLLDSVEIYLKDIEEMEERYETLFDETLATSTIHRVKKKGNVLKESILAYINGGAIRSLTNWVKEMFGRNWSQEGEGSVEEFIGEAEELLTDMELYVQLEKGRTSLLEYLDPEDGVLENRFQEVSLKLGQEFHVEDQVTYETKIEEFRERVKQEFDDLKDFPIADLSLDYIKDLATAIDIIQDDMDETEQNLDESEKRSEHVFNLNALSPKRVGVLDVVKEIEQDIMTKANEALETVTKAIDSFQNSRNDQEHTKEDKTYFKRLVKSKEAIEKILGTKGLTINITYYSDEDLKIRYISDIELSPKFRGLSKDLITSSESISSLKGTNIFDDNIDALINLVELAPSIILGHFLSSRLANKSEAVLIDFESLTEVMLNIYHIKMTSTLKNLKVNFKIDLRMEDYPFVLRGEDEITSRKVIVITKAEAKKIKTRMKKK
jgi:hypothetical protein